MQNEGSEKGAVCGCGLSEKGVFCGCGLSEKGVVYGCGLCVMLHPPPSQRTSGRSLMEYKTTPWYCAVFSVILPSPDLRTLLP